MLRRPIFVPCSLTKRVPSSRAPERAPSCRARGVPSALPVAGSSMMPKSLANIREYAPCAVGVKTKMHVGSGSSARACAAPPNRPRARSTRSRSRSGMKIVGIAGADEFAAAHRRAGRRARDRAPRRRARDRRRRACESAACAARSSPRRRPECRPARRFRRARSALLGFRNIPSSRKTHAVPTVGWPAKFISFDGREDAHARRRAGASRRKDEGRLGEVRLARDPSASSRRREAGRVVKDRQRVAFERRLGEDVDDPVVPAFRRS